MMSTRDGANSEKNIHGTEEAAGIIYGPGAIKLFNLACRILRNYINSKMGNKIDEFHQFF